MRRDYGVAEPKIEVSENWFTMTFPRPMVRGVSGQGETEVQVEGQEVQVEDQEVQVELQKWEIAVLDMCARQDATGAQLLESAGYARRTGNFRRGLKKLLKLGFLEMTIPEKPRSSKQRYRITSLGQEVLTKHSKRKAGK